MWERKHSADARTVNLTRSQRNKTSGNAGRATVSNSRNAQTKAALCCYECEGIGHFGRECPTRLKRQAKFSESPRERNPSKRSRCSRSPGSKRGGKFGVRKMAKWCERRHLHSPGNAVTIPTVSALLECGTSSVLVNIEGK